MTSSRALAPLLLLAAAASQAATLQLRVADREGRPLADAVLMLEPAAGKAPAVAPQRGVVIAQEKRQFQPRLTVVTVGTPVEFPNLDSVRHHVYSFSPAKPFELRLYAGRPEAPVVFDQPGVVVLGCNIHDRMLAWVVVVDTPWHARTGTDGRAQLTAVPPGAYRLRAWHAGLRPGTEPPAVPLTLGADGATQELRLDVAEATP